MTTASADVRSVERGVVAFGCTPDESVCDPIGSVHGGLVCPWRTPSPVLRSCRPLDRGERRGLRFETRCRGP